jgi:hypothetical protein
MGSGWLPSTEYQCDCCSPSRQIYFRAQGRLWKAYHEADHSKAVKK